MWSSQIWCKHAYLNKEVKKLYLINFIKNQCQLHLRLYRIILLLFSCFWGNVVTHYFYLWWIFHLFQLYSERYIAFNFTDWCHKNWGTNTVISPTSPLEGRNAFFFIFPDNKQQSSKCKLTSSYIILIFYNRVSSVFLRLPALLLTWEQKPSVQISERELISVQPNAFLMGCGLVSGQSCWISSKSHGACLLITSL